MTGGVSSAKPRDAKVRKVEGRWQVLLQKRSENKDSFPGLLDISSAGHLDPGETYESGAWRELSEELGIREEDIAGGRLRYLFMFRSLCRIISFKFRRAPTGRA